MRVPAISIVIPTYNTAAMTLGCCRSVLSSMPESSELIVVDDGSHDGTVDVLSSQAPQVRVLRLETNRGFAAAANRGVAEATGDIILLLNSDAVVEDGALQAFLSAFENDSSLGVAGARLLEQDGRPQWSGGTTPTLLWMIGVVSGAGHLARRFRRKIDDPNRGIDWVSGAAMAFRRAVWRDAGPLSERFLFYCQDLDFCVHARAAGWKIRIIENARVVHALGGTVAGSSRLRQDPERLWSDLLAWGSGYYGRRWAVVARMVLIAAALGRIAVGAVRGDESTPALVRAIRRLADRS